MGVFHVEQTQKERERMALVESVKDLRSKDDLERAKVEALRELTEAVVGVGKHLADIQELTALQLKVLSNGLKVTLGD